MNADQTMLDQLSGCIIGCALNVANTLGSGFLEKVYENALAFELRKAGNSVKQQYSMTVAYSGIIVGNYTVDLLVEEKVLVEIKATKALNDVHSAQCLNYLRATARCLCLLLNFGRPRLEFKRIVSGF